MSVSDSSNSVGGEYVAIFRISGMHCHRCEQKLQNELSKHTGVSEVEVDFPSAQASVVFDANEVAVSILRQTIVSAGYSVLGLALVSHKGEFSEQAS